MDSVTKPDPDIVEHPDALTQVTDGEAATKPKRRRQPVASRKHMPSPRPPNRNRRANFAFATVGISMVMMAIFAFKNMGSEVQMSALDGFKDIAIFIGCAYIGGSAMDFGTMMFTRGQRGRARGRGGYDAYEDYGNDYAGGYEGQPDGRITD